MGTDQAISDAKAILRWVINDVKKSFTQRECLKRHEGRVKRVDRLKKALAVLTERHIISEPCTKLQGDGRAYSTRLILLFMVEVLYELARFSASPYRQNRQNRQNTPRTIILSILSILSREKSPPNLRRESRRTDKTPRSVSEGSNGVAPTYQEIVEPEPVVEAVCVNPHTKGTLETHRKSLEDIIYAVILNAHDRIIKARYEQPYKTTDEIRKAEAEIKRLQHEVMNGQANLSDYQAACTDGYL